jgi:hypothetical protein
MSLVLDTTNKKIELTLDEAVTTNELTFMTSYADQGVTSFVPGSNDGQSNGTNDVTIVSAPSSNTYRLVKSITIYNKDTVDTVVTIKLDNNGTERELIKITLETGDTLEFDEDGWKVISSEGYIKKVNSVMGYDGSAYQKMLTDSSGRAIVRPGDGEKLFGFSSVENESVSENNASVGVNDLIGSTVPTGEIWVIVWASARNIDNNPGRIQIRDTSTGAGAAILDDTSPATGVWATWEGTFFLSGGKDIECRFQSCTAGDRLRFGYAYYVLSAP